MSQPTGTPGLDIDHLGYSRSFEIFIQGIKESKWLGAVFFSDLGFFFFQKIFVPFFVKCMCGGTILSLKDRVAPSTSKGEDLNSEMPLK